jgi:3-hydroxyacyl-[acyl-carrier-protein] dehydratase
MVDRILSWTPKERICGVKTVSFEEVQLRARLGDASGLPPTLVLESLFQLGNWLIILSSGFTRMGLVVRTERAEFPSCPGPGESVLMNVTARRYRDDGILFDGIAESANRTLLHGRGCLAIPVPLCDYQDPDDLRMLFTEIRGADAAVPG